MLNSCTANNKCPEVTRCGHVKVAPTIVYGRKLKYTEKAGVVLSQLHATS